MTIHSRKRANYVFIVIFVVAIGLMLAACFGSQIVLWIDAAIYIPRFQQALDEQCPDNSSTVTLDGLSYDPVRSWGDSEAYCYLNPSGAYICTCEGNSK